jgi:hypothetical protein
LRSEKHFELKRPDFRVRRESSLHVEYEKKDEALSGRSREYLSKKRLADATKTSSMTSELGDKLLLFARAKAEMLGETRMMEGKPRGH